MNQINFEFEYILYNPFNKSNSLFQDPNEPDSHYFYESDYDSKYFQVNRINALSNRLTQHENLSILNLNVTSFK